MFKSKDFSIVEWIILFFVVPIPLLNIGLLIYIILKIGLLPTLKKLLILLVIYVIATLIALMFLSF